MAGEVAFFELGVEDVGRGRAFYEGLFGWRFDTGPSGEGFAIGTGNVPGGLHGGDKGAAPYLFFRVDDMEAAVSAATTRGRRSGCISRRAVPDRPAHSSSAMRLAARAAPSVSTGR
jgi:predicted enzyme related to lactoylglutathione lyase